MRKTYLVLGSALLAMLGLSYCNSIEMVVEAQTLPATVKVGVVPDVTVSGYLLSLDGGASVKVEPAPAQTTCTDYFTGVTSTCTPLSVSVPSYGQHSLSIIAYINPDQPSGNLGGQSTATVIPFKLGPPNASGGKFIK